MKTNLISGLLAFVLVGSRTGCRENEEGVAKANTEAATFQSDARTTGPAIKEQKDQAQQKFSDQMKTLDAKMAELKAKAQSAGDKAKAEWETQRPRLEAQRDAAAKKLEELRTSTKETWLETKAKTEAAFAELEKGFKEAWSKLKE